MCPAGPGSRHSGVVSVFSWGTEPEVAGGGLSYRIAERTGQRVPGLPSTAADAGVTVAFSVEDAVAGVPCDSSVAAAAAVLSAAELVGATGVPRLRHTLRTSATPATTAVTVAIMPRQKLSLAAIWRADGRCRPRGPDFMMTPASYLGTGQRSPHRRPHDRRQITEKSDPPGGGRPDRRRTRQGSEERKAGAHNVRNGLGVRCGGPTMTEPSPHGSAPAAARRSDRRHLRAKDDGPAGQEPSPFPLASSTALDPEAMINRWISAPSSPDRSGPTCSPPRGPRPRPGASAASAHATAGAETGP